MESGVKKRQIFIAIHRLIGGGGGWGSGPLLLEDDDDDEATEDIGGVKGI